MGNKHVSNRDKKDKPVIKIKQGENKKEKSSYKKFKAMIEAYKVQNPVKYALKKEALKAKLKKLK